MAGTSKLAKLKRFRNPMMHFVSSLAPMLAANVASLPSSLASSCECALSGSVRLPAANRSMIPIAQRLSDTARGPSWSASCSSVRKNAVRVPVENAISARITWLWENCNTVRKASALPNARWEPGKYAAFNFQVVQVELTGTSCAASIAGHEAWQNECDATKRRLA